MARPKGSKNTKQAPSPTTLKLSMEARIEFLANLIVDRIEQDQKDGQTLLKKLEAK